jgi:hypothetical protein
MGTVYQVFDEVSLRRLALKECVTRRNEEKQWRQIRNFEREFYTLSQLAHPRVVAVYDYGVENELPYYTMELLDGGCLEELSPLPWRETCSLLLDICSALSLLHSRRQLHGDISPQNIRCTQNGEAKLMDFGAMIPMGVGTQVVGTPVSTSPEMMDMLALDARADLFSLGATAYYVLTGRYAYPASQFNQLRDMWRSRPIPTRDLVRDIPQELDSLVLSMLQIKPSSRPSSGAEVFDKLCDIASLEPEESLAVSRSYLTIPTMVGRSAPLHTVRKRMLGSIAANGGSVLVSGPAGSGRSCFLDACVLEARLTGAEVLRLDGLETEDEDWAAVRTLVSRLRPNLGELTRIAIRPLIPVLGHIFPELVSDAGDDRQDLGVELIEFDDPWQRKLALQKALLGFVDVLCDRRHLVLAMDNLHKMDESSLSFLAAYSQALSAMPIVLIATIEEGASSSSEEAMRLLRESSETILLGNLSREETEALLASVFGDVQSLSRFADRLFGLSRGNPRDVMQLARYLVDRELVIYRDGTWILPTELDEADMPSSLDDALARRLEMLEAEALELIRTLAFSTAKSCSFEKCLDFTEHRDEARLTRVVNDLMAAEILNWDGARYTFCHHDWIPLLTDKF